jgi:AcrR family transcriptional regulator
MTVESKQESNTTTQRDPEQTRRRLLDAAVKLFSKKGRDGTSVDEICQASGVNCRMIYHYFGSKEGLYLAMLAHVYGRIREIVVKPDKNSQSLKDYIETLTERYFRFLQANPEFVAVLRWENASGAEGIRTLDLDEFRGQYIEATSQALGEAKGKQVITDKSLLIILTCCSLCGYYFSNCASMSYAFGVDLADREFSEQWLTHIKQVAVKYFCE